jgi:hypothetical protein
MHLPYFKIIFRNCSALHSDEGNINFSLTQLAKIPI